MRNGKIARLPHDIRQELNGRLETSEDGSVILDWLNGLPEVQELLKDRFGGSPISQQNLSDWRLGGFREWEIRQELVDQACELTDWSGDLGEAIETPLLAGDLVAILAARYAAVLNSWDGEPDPKLDEKLRALRGLGHDLALVQRTSHRADKQRAAFHQRLEDDSNRADAQLKREALAPFWAAKKTGLLAEYFGGGEGGKKIADYIIAVENDWPLPKLAGEKPTGQAQSNPVKPKTEIAPAQADPQNQNALSAA